MEYRVVITKKFRYVKAYNVIRSVRGNMNIVSRLLQGFVERYILKGKKE